MQDITRFGNIFLYIMTLKIESFNTISWLFNINPPALIHDFCTLKPSHVSDNYTRDSYIKSENMIRIHVCESDP